MNNISSDTVAKSPRHLRSSHHNMQKVEVKNAIETINSAAHDFDVNADMESVMSVDTAFHRAYLPKDERENMPCSIYILP
jgi:predicted RNA methylase